MDSACLDSIGQADRRAQIHEWICAYVGQLVAIPRDQIDGNLSFDEYGLDSTAAAGLSGDLSDWLGLELEANIAKKYRTIEQLADKVSSLVTSRAVKS
jgi:acyl carrier protein